MRGLPRTHDPFKAALSALSFTLHRSLFSSSFWTRLTRGSTTLISDTMRRNANYKALNEENTEYSNYHEYHIPGDETVSKRANVQSRLTHFPKEHATEPHHGQRPTEYDQAGGNRLQRFYFRALVGVLGPFAVCGYFLTIWRLYIDPVDKSEGPLTFGRQSATWIFYSWFVAGVIGLGLSLYGLAGVQAAMLMEPTWQVSDATKLMLHAENSWSGPGGWLKTLKWSLNPRRRSGVCCRSPSLLWFILALPSLLVFVAWPLSGLSLEITEGYHDLHATNPANMTGFSFDTFNERGTDEAYLSAALKWASAQLTMIPGVGVAYTRENFDRSKVAFLNKLPVVLPEDDGIPTIFLTPQSDKPAKGNAWGLLLQYQCSIIHKAEDFQIIHKKYSSDFPWADLPDQVLPPDNGILLFKDNNSILAGMNQTDGSWTSNLQAYLEIGFQSWTSGDEDALYMMVQPDIHDCYLKKTANSTKDYPGIDQEQILELALWQRLRTGYIKKNYSLEPNYSIDHNITDYFGKYDVRDFKGLSEEDYLDREPQPMTAIGVQCRASSNMGSADINALRSSFSNFQRTDTPPRKVQNRCARRFEAATPYYILTNWTLNTRWLFSLFTAGAAPPPFTGQTSPTKIIDFLKEGIMYDTRVQLSFLQAEQLKRAMLQAYASYAASLMFSTGYAINDSFLNPNASEFASGQVIKQGVMPALVPLSLFLLWATISSALGLIYGFRRRWAETLDGPTMFRLGAELSDDNRRQLLKTSNILKTEDCAALDDIPALVGDTKPEMWLGRIGLVKDVKAHKKKFYE